MKNDYSLSSSKCVTQNDKDVTSQLEKAIALPRKAGKRERG